MITLSRTTPQKRHFVSIIGSTRSWSWRPSGMSFRVAAMLEEGKLVHEFRTSDHSYNLNFLLKTIRGYWSKRLSCNHQFFSELFTTQKRICFTWCHRKRSLLILFTMQSYKSYMYWVRPGINEKQKMVIVKQFTEHCRPLWMVIATLFP